MSWVHVARKDIQDAGRSRALWALIVLFVLLSALIVYAFGELLGGTGGADIIGLIGVLQSPMNLFIGIIALLVGHKAIVGERESGSLKLLLSLPHSRLDVVLGKLAGRTLVLWIAIAFGFVTGTVVWFVIVGAGSFGSLALFGGLTLLYGLAYMSVAVALSASTRSGSRATALAIGFWLLFQFLWSLVVLALRFVAGGFDIAVLANPAPDWAAFLQSLSLTQAYGLATVRLIPGAAEAGAIGSSFYSSGWWALIILVLWIVAPLAFGYWRFNQADL